MLFDALMTGKLSPDINEHAIIVHSCVKSGGTVSTAAAHTVADEIKDHSIARRTRHRSSSTYRRRRNQGSQYSSADPSS
jgi:hypothetical protein